MLRGELGHVDGPAAADAGHRLVGGGPERLPRLTAVSMGGVLHPEDLGLVDAETGRDAIALLAGADRDRDPALRRDPAVGQQRPEVGDGTPPHVNGERRGKHAGQERHGPPSLPMSAAPQETSDGWPGGHGPFAAR